jgi:hypothetical protein
MYVMEGSSTLFSSGYGLPPQQPDVPFTLSNVGVLQGQAIDFVVNSGGNDGNDVLGIVATITPSVPAPSAASLLVLIGGARLLTWRGRSSTKPDGCR